MKNYHQKSSLGLYILLFVAAAIQFASKCGFGNFALGYCNVPASKYCLITHAAVNAQLLCYSSSDYQCNGPLIEDIDSVSDCCSMSDAQWYIQDTNSSLDSNDTLKCLACVRKFIDLDTCKLNVLSYI